MGISMQGKKAGIGMYWTLKNQSVFQYPKHAVAGFFSVRGDHKFFKIVLEARNRIRSDDERDKPSLLR